MPRPHPCASSLLVPFACALAALAAPACAGDDPPTGRDGGRADTGMAADTAVATDTGTPPDAGPAGLVIEDAPGGTGFEVGARSLASGRSLLLYAVARAADGSFIADVPATWTLTGTAATLDPLLGTSTLLTAMATGLGEVTITATHLTYGTDDAGPITITSCTTATDCTDPCFSTVDCVSGTCTPIGAADKDLDLDTYVDATCPGGTDCDDSVGTTNPGAPDLCDLVDNDCDPMTADGSGVMMGSACDGPDRDLCLDDTFTGCMVGVPVCSTGADNLELCNGIDDDCDPMTPDGADDPMVGGACDGPDSDLCLDDTLDCAGGTITCSTGPDDLDLCDGMDNDCNPATADGSSDPATGMPCDGPDSDLCLDDTGTCISGAIGCSTGPDTLDICNGMDDDCDPASADGSEDPALGSACDGPDLDACRDDTYTGCASSMLVCATGPDICGTGGGSYGWDITMGSSAVDDVVDVVVDGAGNVTIAGAFTGTVDFDPGPGTAARTSTFGTDVFVASYDATGAFRWVYALGGRYSAPRQPEQAYGLAVDGAGNITVTGLVYTTTINFGGATRSCSNVPYECGFVVGLSNTGTYRWDKLLASSAAQPGQSYVRPLGVAANPATGDVFVVGVFANGANLGGGDLSGRGDMFLVKYDSAGAYQWARTFGGAGAPVPMSVAADSAGNLVVVGTFSGGVNFGSGVRTPSASWRYNGFIVGYAPDGFTVRWLRELNGANFGWQDVNDVALDSLGNAAVTGYFRSPMDFGGGARSPAGRNGFVASYAPDGTYRWDKNIGGASEDLLQSVTIGTGDSVTVTGGFASPSIDFGGGARASNGGYDVMVASYTAGGAYRWDRTFGWTGADWGLGVAAGTGAMYVVGSFSNLINFGGGVRAGAGGTDGYLLMVGD